MYVYILNFLHNVYSITHVEYTVYISKLRIHAHTHYMMHFIIYTPGFSNENW